MVLHEADGAHTHLFEEQVLPVVQVPQVTVLPQSSTKDPQLNPCVAHVLVGVQVPGQLPTVTGLCPTQLPAGLYKQTVYVHVVHVDAGGTPVVELQTLDEHANEVEFAQIMFLS